MANVISGAEANRRLYADIAERYEEDLGRVHVQVVQRVKWVLATAPRCERVLDACGGSGQVSMALLELGIDPVLVDVSPDLLELYRRKAEGLGHAPCIYESAIESFLVDNPRTWDIIFFFSALHHLEDYEAVLKAAIDRLAPGGVLATAHDPTAAGRTGRWLRRTDYYLHLLSQQPRTLASAARGKLRRRATADAAVGGVDYGFLAERHALTGIDDRRLAEQLVGWGMTIVRHDRVIDDYTPVARSLFRLLRRPSNFGIVAMRPENKRDRATSSQ